MTGQRDLRQRLEEAGARPVPPPDPGFADHLDARLRAVYPSVEAPASRNGAHWRSRPPTRRWLGLAAAVLVLAVVGTLARGGSEDLTLTTATATDVVLSDGTVVVGRVGLLLPEGALVRAGEGGSAAAGHVEVSGGSTAVVIDGELVVVDEEAPSPTVAPTTTSAPAATDPPPATGPPTTRRTTTTTTGPTTTTTAPPVRIDLRVNRAADAAVVLRWSRYERADFARYVVLRIQGGHPMVTAQRFEAGATDAVDRPPAGRVGYRIVVLDREGRVVGGSPVVGP